MYVRVRVFGEPDKIVFVESKLTKIEQLRRIIKEKFSIQPKLQRLFYGGKLLENGYTFHDYNIKLNDVIQLIVKVQPDDGTTTDKVPEISEEKKVEDDSDNKEKMYTDAESTLYAIGDLIDTRDSESGAWLEAKIVRIVLNPNAEKEITTFKTDLDNENGSEQSGNKENDVTSSTDGPISESPKIKPNGIAKHFSKTPKSKKQTTKESVTRKSLITDENLLFKVQLDTDDENDLYCKLKDIRPRARTTVDVSDLNTGQTYMINHNIEEPLQKGSWYDFKVDKILKIRNGYNLLGTLYLGSDAIPQHDTTVRVHDKIFLIEDVVPLQLRTDEYNKKMCTIPDKRSRPLNCLTCRDDFDVGCKDCGCYLCSGKEDDGSILLCDECNNGFHMKCLSPPLTQVPEGDWYCPSCKRDPNDVIAPGAAKQIKKSTKSAKSERDWGRGMACVGKTKTCAMPPNHFGPIPGIEVGMRWRFRIQLSESGVHRPPVSGIHGRDVEGAYSIVLSGGYEDDVDRGDEFTYTGSGGRDLSGNKRTAEQSYDQTLTRENKALARNCAVKLNESGADAGDDWKEGKPVRVARSYKMLKHFPKYAPKEGLRYDGIYKVVKYYQEKGLSGYRVWKYLLRRDDPAPAPWESGAKQYPIIYPDGYLEAEAEKKVLKEKNNAKTTKGGRKRALQESNVPSESDDSLPAKKLKTEVKKSDITPAKTSKKVTRGSQNTKIADMIKNQKSKSPKDKSPLKSEQSKENSNSALGADEIGAIKADTINSKLWDECLEVCERKTKQDFIEHVTEVFRCIICQGVAVNPVTTPCLHNFCLSCIKLAFERTESQKCPYCRNILIKEDLQTNEKLRTALRAILAGYDARK
ncbi:E3 ubiquitin-protein ligase UHRF1-like [Epargyreus clarus]|uniref:E3 ubiquitin-protein ligase UHRF1-like n=1 Tax=Epargyreus clarus TaxID=520877 RepID=UPI003C2C3FE1